MIIRTAQILWAFGRRNLVATLYLDVYRTRLSSRSCACEDDNKLAKRAIRLRHALEDLGPVFMKLGQMLASRGDMLPPAYVKELELLQDHARAIPYADIKASLEAVCICEHGPDAKASEHEAVSLCIHCQKISGVFDAFEEEPLAVASLAQVHRAKFQGNDVVVKILKPAVLDVINQDLAILYRLRNNLLSWIGLSKSIDADEFHADLQRSLHAEVDLQAEGLHMDIFRDHSGHGISTPKVYWGFGRDDILVMEFIDGLPLDKVGELSIKTRKELASRLAVGFLEQVLTQNLFHCDPHPGNLFLRGEEIIFIDFGSVVRLDPAAHDSLRKFLMSISNGDVEEATAHLLELCGRSADEIVQFPGLLLDMGLIVQGFKTGSGTRWSDRIVEMARRYKLKLPRGVIGLAKALVLIEAMALKLDPDFRLQEPIERFIEQAAPEDLKERFHDIDAALSDYANLLGEAPAILRRLSTIAAEEKTNDKKK